jgi:hypothetical protein
MNSKILLPTEEQTTEVDKAKLTPEARALALRNCAEQVADDSRVGAQAYLEESVAPFGGE